VLGGQNSLLAINNGGEVHTFTRVVDYGGGVVPFLNDLAGTPNVAPECVAEGTFVPPGGTDSDTPDKTGELKFQCCIHPWMRNDRAGEVALTRPTGQAAASRHVWPATPTGLRKRCTIGSCGCT
jgi:hypothetical protein